MKLRRSYAFLTFKISDDGSSIVVDQALDVAQAARIGTDATYGTFVAAMPEKEGRYGVLEVEYDSGLEGVRSRLVFIAWNPSEAKIRSRMVYASSKAAIRQRLDGIYSEVQCTDAGELAFESVFEQIAPKGSQPVSKAPSATEE
ncbi:hypothetical protein BC831DRAFT_444848 [Entophlyctis helioformis]|nr:hypothetical protein BC831DRAFT_444848 [Entophlyctis helioformis]